jgi:hypothetical protein
MMDDYIHPNGSITHTNPSDGRSGYSNKELVGFVQGPYEIIRLEAVMPGFVLVVNRINMAFPSGETLGLNTTASALADRDVYGFALLCPTDRVD